MNIREIAVVILVAILIWFIGYYFLYWLPGGYVFSFALSILGAIVFVGIAKKFNLAERASGRLISAAIGSVVVLFAVTSFLTFTSRKEIIINCKNRRAYPNLSYADINDGLNWRSDGSTEKNYTIQFKIKSPFNDNFGGQKMTVPSDPALGKTPPEKVHRYGYFEYGFTCADGTIVDPMIQVPVP